MYLAYRNLRYAPKISSRILLECIRLLVLILIIVTFFRPELIREEQRTLQPEILILDDATGSMTTRDVVVERKLLSRREWLDRQIQRKFWQPLESKYKIVRKPFNSEEGVPTRTNIESALMDSVADSKNLRAILMLSDGDWNEGDSPILAANQLFLKKIPAFTIVVGPDAYLPDISIDEVKVPSFTLIKETVSIPFRVSSRLKREVRANIVLRSKIKGQTIVIAKKNLTIPAGAIVQDNILWHAKTKGKHELTLELPTQAEEIDLENNKRQFIIDVRQEILKVLVIDSFPRWEYRFLRNALSRDQGVEVRCLLFHPGMNKRGAGTDYIQEFPRTRAELSKYDVIFLGDVGVGNNELSTAQLEMIKGLVAQQGSGLVLIPGIRGRQLSLLDSPIADLIPVVMDKKQAKGIRTKSEAHLLLTSTGMEHLLTMLADSPEANRLLWKRLPGFLWCGPVTKARPGSHVLGVHSLRNNEWGKLPLLVTRKHQNGNILFMGIDNAWRWRKGVEDTFHYRFWSQVVSWMAHPRHQFYNEGLRVFSIPEKPRQGDNVTLIASVFASDGRPLKDTTLIADIIGPKGKQSSINFIPMDGDWGVSQGKFIARESGNYTLNIRTDGHGYQLTSTIQVKSVNYEKVGYPARIGTMRDIASVTKGSFGFVGDLDNIIKQINLLPKQESIIHRTRIWSQWWWAGLIILLLVIYWIYRKLLGLI